MVLCEQTSVSCPQIHSEHWRVSGLGFSGEQAEAPLVQGLPRGPGQPPLTPLPSFTFTCEADRQSSSINIKRGLCSLLNLAKILFMSYVQLVDLGVRTAPSQLGGPRCQVLEVLVLSACPPGRCCSGSRGRGRGAGRSVWLRREGGGRHIRKLDVCHLLI